MFQHYQNSLDAPREKALKKNGLTQKNKEFYYNLLRDCGAVIEDCPNKEKRTLACEYCRFEEVRKKTLNDVYELMTGELEPFIPLEIANEIIERLGGVK